MAFLLQINPNGYTLLYHLLSRICPIWSEFFTSSSCKQTPCSAEFVARTPFIYYWRDLETRILSWLKNFNLQSHFPIFNFTITYPSPILLPPYYRLTSIPPNLAIPCIYLTYTQHIAYIYTTYSLHIHNIYPTYSLHIPNIYITYTLHISYI